MMGSILLQQDASTLGSVGSKFASLSEFSEKMGSKEDYEQN